MTKISGDETLLALEQNSEVLGRYCSTIREDSCDFDTSQFRSGDFQERWSAFLSFAQYQIETYPHYDDCSNPKWTKDHLETAMTRGHPIDAIPTIILTEPSLMLSNLSIEQLMHLRAILRTDMERNLVYVWLVSGYIVGKAAEMARSSEEGAVVDLSSICDPNT